MKIDQTTATRGLSSRNPRETSRPSNPTEGRAFSSWEEMEAVHAIERAEMVKRVYRAGLSKTLVPGPGSMNAIASAVAQKHGFTLAMIRGMDRRQIICDVRHEAWYLMHKAKYSMPRIGIYFNNRDHSTVSSGIRRHIEKFGGEL